MNINVRLGKNFTTAFNKAVDTYGEDFELLNDHLQYLIQDSQNIFLLEVYNLKWDIGHLVALLL